MKALCWQGKGNVSVNEVPDPSIEEDSDVIVKVSSTAICGSDLHLYNGFMPTMQSGDVLGHEFMGEIVDVGKSITKVKVGDRVVVPFHISCGECFFCKRGEFSACDRTNPNASIARAALGQSPAAMFGYSHMMGGLSGGQAEYVRVPRGTLVHSKSNRT